MKYVWNWITNCFWCSESASAEVCGKSITSGSGLLVEHDTVVKSKYAGYASVTIYAGQHPETPQITNSMFRSQVSPFRMPNSYTRAQHRRRPIVRRKGAPWTRYLHKYRPKKRTTYFHPSNLYKKRYLRRKLYSKKENRK